MKKIPAIDYTTTTEKKAARKPRLSKEERDARKLKLKEERAAKKAARLAKREAKKQKEAEKKAAAKAKREERKAKKAARIQAEKARKEALELKRKERAEAKKAREAARVAKKAERKNRVKKEPEVKKVSVQEKIEAERNEWKALSAIRRYVRDNAKILAELEGEKLARRVKKLQKMGYLVDVENGTPILVGYNFITEVKTKAKKARPGKKDEDSEDDKGAADTQQPQVFADAEKDSTQTPEEGPSEADAEEPLLTDEEIIDAATSESALREDEVLIGDSYADETEIASNVEAGLAGDSNDAEDDEDDEDEDEDDDDEDEDDDEKKEKETDDDLLDFGISREQEEYRHEAFREMEANGNWD